MKITYAILIIALSVTTHELLSRVPWDDRVPSDDKETRSEQKKQAQELYSELISVIPIEKTDTYALFEVEYIYDGKYGKDVSIKIKPIVDVAYWSHENVLAIPGHHKVTILLKHPGWSNVPDVIDVNKVEILMKVSIYDQERDKNYSHKMLTKLLDFNHSFHRDSSD